MSEQLTAPPDQQPGREDSRRRGVIILALAVLVIVLLLASFLRSLARVPDITGLPGERAEQVLRDAGFSAGNIGERIVPSAPAGTVVEQSPTANNWAFRASLVDFVVSSAGLADSGAATDEDLELLPAAQPQPDEGEEAPEDRPAEVFGPFAPNVLGMSRTEAQATLARFGYRYSVRSGPSTTSIGSGRVFYQSIAPHEPASRGSLVVIWLSTGPPGPADRSPRPERPYGLY